MVGLRPISPARTLCRTKGAGLCRAPVTTQLLIHGKVFSGRPAFLERSLQPSHQRSRSIHSVAFGAITLCPDAHKCSLWRGQLPVPSRLVCGTLLQPAAAARAGCEGSEAPRGRARGLADHPAVLSRVMLRRPASSQAASGKQSGLDRRWRSTWAACSSSPRATTPDEARARGLFGQEC